MNIKEMRQRFNIKQITISMSLGIGKNTYSQYENGRRQPPIATLPKLAKIFECSIEEVVLALIETKQQCEKSTQEEVI